MRPDLPVRGPGLPVRRPGFPVQQKCRTGICGPRTGNSGPRTSKPGRIQAINQKKVHFWPKNQFFDHLLQKMENFENSTILQWSAHSSAQNEYRESSFNFWPEFWDDLVDIGCEKFFFDTSFSGKLPIKFWEKFPQAVTERVPQNYGNFSYDK